MVIRPLLELRAFVCVANGTVYVLSVCRNWTPPSRTLDVLGLRQPRAAFAQRLDVIDFCRRCGEAALEAVRAQRVARGASGASASTSGRIRAATGSAGPRVHPGGVCGVAECVS